MKIALYFPGFLRNFEDTYPSFKEYIIDKIHPDIFFSGYPNLKGLEYCEKRIVELWNPKKYEIREYNETFKNKICKDYGKYFLNKRPETPPENVISQAYNIKRCDEMRIEYEIKNNFQYDIIIKSRVDFFYFKSYEESDLIRSMNGELLIPSEWDFKEVHPDATSDITAIGNRDSMNKYSQLYDYIDHYFNLGHVFHAETYMGIHIKNMNLNRTGVDGKGWVTFDNLNNSNYDRKFF
jgi:hypothetical protein